MKVVLDTNVFVSGFFWAGCSRDVLLAWQQGMYALVSSTPILLELSKVLHDFKIKLPEEVIRQRIHVILTNSIIVEPSEHLDVVTDDPKDNMFIEAALAGKADFIVTQDKHLLRLKKINGIKIITPKEFSGLIKVTVN